LFFRNGQFEKLKIYGGNGQFEKIKIYGGARRMCGGARRSRPILNHPLSPS